MDYLKVSSKSSPASVAGAIAGMVKDGVPVNLPVRGRRRRQPGHQGHRDRARLPHPHGIRHLLCPRVLRHPHQRRVAHGHQARGVRACDQLARFRPDRFRRYADGGVAHERYSFSQPALSGKTYFIRTFGCQMNLHDAERVSGLLDSCGCLEVSEPAEADIVVFMTCCVREAADQRLYGQCSSCKSLPAPPSGKRVIAVGGCIAQRDGEGLLVNVDNVNVIFGTHAITHVARLIEEAFEDDERHVDVAEQVDAAATDLPWHRQTAYHAWVPIMTGCATTSAATASSPYVRGREKSRLFESVVDEVTGLVRAGVREVTLLGQNVNSYGRDLYGAPRFADLLRAVGGRRVWSASASPPRIPRTSCPRPSRPWPRCPPSCRTSIWRSILALRAS